jgi:hypothetical protein
LAGHSPNQDVARSLHFSQSRPKGVSHRHAKRQKAKEWDGSNDRNNQPPGLPGVSDSVHTITTVPPATLDAFRDRGRVRVTLGTEEEEAEAVLAAAAALGLDLHTITEQLQTDGINPVASSFDHVVTTVGEKRSQSLTTRADVRPLVVFMIGHSTRTIDDFIRLLKAHGVQRVIDVRTIPRTRHNPQFNRGHLSPILHRARGAASLPDAVGAGDWNPGDVSGHRCAVRTVGSGWEVTKMTRLLKTLKLRSRTNDGACVR